MSRIFAPMKTDDYISRQVIHYRKLWDYDETGTGIPVIAVSNDEIDAIPPADVVQVVRCRDCKHYFAYPGWVSTCHEHYEIDGVSRRVSPDSFCSFGERREDDGE